MSIAVCTYCEGVAATYCKLHKQCLCADPNCFALHRWDGEEPCHLVPAGDNNAHRIELVDLVLAGMGLAVALLFFFMLCAHYGGVQ